MAFIEWHEKFSVGIDEIDAQHKKWFGIINELHESLIKSKGIKNLEKIVEEMEEYTRYHFSEEEKMLEKEGYEYLDRHRQIHFSFKQEIRRLKGDIFSGEMVLRTQVMSVLKNWLEDHILKEDKKYGEFICAKK